MRTALSGVLVLLLFSAPLHAGAMKPVGVVQSQYDDVEKYMRIFRVPYVTLDCRDLESQERLNTCRAVFVPSGVEPPIETNVNVQSRGTVIQGVTLREKYYAMDPGKVHDAVKRYIAQGGICYFSGFSYSILQGATGCFDFFDDFPFIGMAGTVHLELDGDLRSFCSARTLDVNIPYSGWVAARNMRGAEVLASGSYDTPRGKKNGPVTGIMPRGDGEACYTSLYGDECSPGLMRFFVMRLSYRYMIDGVRKIVDRWEQVTGSTIVDVVGAGECVRRYHVSVRRGRNTVYFRAESGYYQMDIFDENNALIASRQEWSREFFHSFRSPGKGHVTVKIYPATAKRNAPYALIGAHGMRVFPHWRKVALFFIMALVVGLMVWLTDIVRPKYSGRPR